MSDSGLPPLLTVEEAGRLLRIGRTKAYAMAREWRETDGRSGLPVIDLGHVLRVPRRALEELIGSELTADQCPAPEPTNRVQEQAETPKAPASEPVDEVPPRRPERNRRTRRRQNRMANQLDLFDSESTAG